MIVYFLRHANAGQKRLNLTQDDKRPLDQEGIAQCRYIGRVLASLDVRVDKIFSSSLKRATQTAYYMANELAYEQKVETVAALKPGADYEKFRALINQHRALEAIMVVGHNPNMSRFLSLLVSEGVNERAVEMKKGSLARVEMGPKRAVLNWLVTPRLLQSAYPSLLESSRPNTSKK